MDNKKEDLLVTVDIINGFVNFGNLADKRINQILPKVEKLIQQAIARGTKIISFKDCHEINDEEFKEYAEHCIKGSLESELVPELKKYENRMYLIEKNTTNGFNTNEFRRIISSYSFKNIVVCGCCTDICVKNFCYSLKEYIDKNNLNTNIYVYESAVATFDSEVHKAKQIQTDTLKEMEYMGKDYI